MGYGESPIGIVTTSSPEVHGLGLFERIDSGQGSDQNYLHNDRASLRAHPLRVHCVPHEFVPGITSRH